jgi:hypothetical protein
MCGGCGVCGTPQPPHTTLHRFNHHPTHTRLHSSAHHHTQSIVLAHRILTTPSTSAAAPCSRCWIRWRGRLRWPSMRWRLRSLLAMPSRARSDVSTIVPGSSTGSSTSDESWVVALAACRRWLHSQLEFGALLISQTATVRPWSQ